jgi:hypothetical protein
MRITLKRKYIKALKTLQRKRTNSTANRELIEYNIERKTRN